MEPIEYYKFIICSLALDDHQLNHGHTRNKTLHKIGKSFVVCKSASQLFISLQHVPYTFVRKESTREEHLFFFCHHFPVQFYVASSTCTERKPNKKMHLKIDTPNDRRFDAHLSLRYVTCRVLKNSDTMYCLHDNQWKGTSKRNKTQSVMNIAAGVFVLHSCTRWRYLVAEVGVIRVLFFVYYTGCGIAFFMWGFDGR